MTGNPPNRGAGTPAKVSRPRHEGPRARLDEGHSNNECPMLETTLPRYRASVSKLIAVDLIRRYQTRVSPRLTTLNFRCLYEPSCSEYMILAITKFGLVRGVLAGIRRLTRCRDGFDRVDYP